MEEINNELNKAPCLNKETKDLCAFISKETDNTYEVFKNEIQLKIRHALPGLCKEEIDDLIQRISRCEQGGVIAEDMEKIIKFHMRIERSKTITDENTGNVRAIEWDKVAQEF